MIESGCILFLERKIKVDDNSFPKVITTISNPTSEKKKSSVKGNYTKQTYLTMIEAKISHKCCD
jgi:hypothetical protein